MDIAQFISEINFWPIAVAAASAFIIGWIWYGPLFGKLWLELKGFTEEELKEGGLPMYLIMLLNYGSTALAALGIVLFMGDRAGMGFGILIGVAIALFWIATSRLNDVLYERKPFKLYLINVGYYLIVYVVMGAILGLWH